jgi:hypothetical protein
MHANLLICAYFGRSFSVTGSSFRKKGKMTEKADPAQLENCVTSSSA